MTRHVPSVDTDVYVYAALYDSMMESDDYLAILYHALSWLSWIICVLLVLRLVYLGGKFWWDRKMDVMNNSAGIEIMTTLVGAVLFGAVPEIANKLLAGS